MRSLAILVSAVCVSSVLAQAPKAGKSYAFLVGVSGYKKKELKALPYTPNDVIDFRQALVESGYDESNIAMLHDRQTEPRFFPFRNQIMDEFRLFLDGLRENDSIVVALSGHGVHFKGDKHGYFCPLDADLGNKGTLIPMDGDGGFFPILKACKAKKKLLLVNACRNDPLSDLAQAARKGEIDDTDTDEVPEGIAALYSCREGQKSYYDPDRKRGIFFDHVIRAWKTETTLEDFFEQVVTKTKSDVYRKLSAAQVPVVKREYKGRWLLRDDTVAAREPKPGEERDFEIFPGVKMRFCWIPAGEAQLGSPKTEAKRDDEDEDKRGRFKTAGFWLGKYEVTQSEWKAVMGTNPSWFSATGSYKGRVAGMDTSRFPVEQVSWNDCQAFLKKCTLPGLKLPHEDEWEYACRGGLGNSRPFYFGTELNGREANCNGTNPYGTTVKGPYLKRTTEVGSYEKVSRHPWGLCDMHGNVWEWCENLYDGSDRVDRGGSWSDSAEDCRAAPRDWSTPTGASSYLGLRLARTSSGRGQ